MKVSHITLAGSSIAVLGALVLLMFEVRATPEMEVPADKLAMAQARYEQTKSGSDAPMPRVSPPTAVRPPPSRVPAEMPAGMDDGSGPGDLGQREPKRIQVNSRAAEMKEPMMQSAEPTSEAPKDPKQVKLEELRGFYDQGDYVAALDAAKQFLRETPDDPYVLRVGVVSACASGDEAFAREKFGQMNPRDQRVTRIRCQRFGIEL